MYSAPAFCRSDFDKFRLVALRATELNTEYAIVLLVQDEFTLKLFFSNVVFERIEPNGQADTKQPHPFDSNSLPIKFG